MAPCRSRFSDRRETGADGPAWPPIMIAMAVIPYFAARPTNTAALIWRRIDAGAQFHQRRAVIVLWRLSHAMMQTIYRLTTKSLPRKCLSLRIGRYRGSRF